MLTKIPEGSLEVIELLKEEDLYTMEEIDEKLVNIDQSTLRYAIRRLLEIEIIQSIPDLLDMRTVKYRLTPEDQLQKSINKLPERLQETINNILNNPTNN